MLLFLFIAFPAVTMAFTIALMVTVHNFGFGLSLAGEITAAIAYCITYYGATAIVIWVCNKDIEHYFEHGEFTC